jgi:hypothetical protein
MGRQDNRRHPRFEVQDVRGTFLCDLEVRLLNLSLAGMAVATSTALTVGKRYSFNLTKGERVIRVTGTVAWCVLRTTRPRPGEDVVPVYHAGVHFEDVLTERAQALRDLIDDSGVFEVSTRVFGRFRLDTGCQVTIDSQVQFRVRKISLGGMLVETALAAELNSVFPLELALPTGSLVADGRVAFVEFGTSGARNAPNLLGIEFRDTSAEDLTPLRSFLSTLSGELLGESPEPESADR